jgi:hypothetical protein
MALNHTMILGIYQSGLGNKNMLKITNAGKTTIPVAHQVQNSTATTARQAFVWKGTCYFPTGGTATGSGWSVYNHNTGKFECLGNTIAVPGLFLPLKDRLGWATNGLQMSIEPGKTNCGGGYGRSNS